MYCITVFSKTDFMPDFIGFAVNAVNHQIYAFLISVKQIRYQPP